MSVSIKVSGRFKNNKTRSARVDIPVNRFNIEDETEFKLRIYNNILSVLDKFKSIEVGYKITLDSSFNKPIEYSENLRMNKESICKATDRVIGSLRETLKRYSAEQMS